jgi:hypothetical protein
MRAADSAFRTDSCVYQRAPESGLRVTWMGHSVMLVEIDGLRVLLDPVWHKWAAPVSWIGPTRFFESPLPLAEVPPLYIEVYDLSVAQWIYTLRIDAERLRRVWGLALSPNGNNLAIDSGDAIQVFALPTSK